LGREELKRIAAVIPDYSQFSIDSTVRNVIELKHITQWALDGVSPKPGRKKDVAFRLLVSSLHEIYRQGTGDNRKISYDAYAGGYTGPAFEFICKCLPILDVHKSEGAIVTVIKGAVRSQGN